LSTPRQQRQLQQSRKILTDRMSGPVAKTVKLNAILLSCLIFLIVGFVSCVENFTGSSTLLRNEFSNAKLTQQAGGDLVEAIHRVVYSNFWNLTDSFDRAMADVVLTQQEVVINVIPYLSNKAITGYSFATYRVVSLKINPVTLARDFDILELTPLDLINALSNAAAVTLSHPNFGSMTISELMSSPDTQFIFLNFSAILTCLFELPSLGIQEFVISLATNRMKIVVVMILSGMALLFASLYFCIKVCRTCMHMTS
jgi:uncharacterized membrane protein YqjE